MDFKLEICVDSIESAVNAQVAGAHRVELCASLPEGGTTPSYGLIATVRDNLTIAMNVLIRPRPGDFLYSDAEFEIMARDIEICNELGVDGVVIGLLTVDGEIDKERTVVLAELASPMNVTFHRAFDLCSDPYRGLEDIISTGADRLLTSGQKNKAIDGQDLIDDLVKTAGQRIIIMPGSGIDETNISELAAKTRAKEYHLSGRKLVESEMKFRNEEVKMGGLPGYPEYARKVADTEKIINIIKILKMV